MKLAEVGAESMACYISELVFKTAYSNTFTDFFRRFRIDAITLFALPAVGPHGFHAIGRSVISPSLATPDTQLHVIQSYRVYPPDHQ